MKLRPAIRITLAAALVAASLAVPATASAGACTFQISPNPGWRGAEVTISGFQLGANVNYYVNFNGEQIASGQANSNGAFSFEYTIPADTPVGTVNWFVGSDGCSMDDARDYTILAAAPTTTTVAPATTTTIPSVTSTAAPTTTIGVDTTTSTLIDVTSTTQSGAETTTTIGTTTTTIEIPEDGRGGGGIPIVVWVVIAVVGVAVVFLLGKLSGRRR
jgi:hypothetical protein